MCINTGQARLGGGKIEFVFSTFSYVRASEKQNALMLIRFLGSMYSNVDIQSTPLNEIFSTTIVMYIWSHLCGCGGAALHPACG